MAGRYYYRIFTTEGEALAVSTRFDVGAQGRNSSDEPVRLVPRKHLRIHMPLEDNAWAQKRWLGTQIVDTTTGKPVWTELTGNLHQSRRDTGSFRYTHKGQGIVLGSRYVTLSTDVQPQLG